MNIVPAVKNAQKRFVVVETKSNSGSGVIIATGIVMTCFHCLHTDSEIKVNDKDAEVVAVDAMHDLVLLSVETEDVETVELGQVSLGEQILSVANPMSMSGALLFGRVIFLTDKRIVHDIHGTPGVSGSGLFNFKGELAGINHSVLGTKHIGSHFTIAIPAEKFQKIISQVFHIVQPTEDEVEKYGVK